MYFSIIIESTFNESLSMYERIEILSIILHLQNILYKSFIWSRWKRKLWTF